MPQNSSSSNQSLLTALLRLLMLALLAQSVAGCGSLRYYSQAASGHFDLMSRRQSIDALIADPETDPQLRQRLKTVQEIVRFAADSLGLPDNDSYTRYADLERDAAVYLLTAAPELSLKAKQWCYLIVGCLSYRGYFKKPLAEDEAERLEGEGFDTRIAPSVAYSTLGFMSDPVLNTMLAYPDHQLAGLLFHELAHQVVYAKGDAGFSESFASTVEQVGKARWLAARGRTTNHEAQAHEESREREFNDLVLNTRNQLISVFESDRSDAEKRQSKVDIYQQLSIDYQQWRAGWDGYPGYDHWFERGVNNADLALISTYQSDVPAFLALLADCDDDLPTFYGRVQAIARMEPRQREQSLERYRSGH